MNTTTILIAATTCAAALAGCATTTTAPVPAGMKAGQFVEYACDGGKRLLARAAVDGSTVRVRFEGGHELDRKGDGLYESDGWRFSTSTATAELSHGGKVVARACKPV